MFLNATMLAGVAGAVLPLVLHLLNRARYRNVRWGAMLFLGLDDAAQYRSSRFKEITLLMLRMAIVAVFAIALARPVIGAIASVSPARANAPDEPSCTVIVLDRSGSMAYEENGRPRMDAAKRAVLSVLGALRRGDEAALVLTPEVPNQPPQLTTDLQMLAARAAERGLSNGRADLAGALTAAAHVLETSHSRQKQLVVVCDRQASSWRDVTASFARTWRSSWRDPATGRMPRFSVIPIGGDDAGNVAIESVRVVNLPVIKGTPADVEVVVRSFDPLPRTDLPLIIQLAGKEICRASVDIAPRAVTSARCAVTIPTTGSTVLTARLGPVGIPADDSMECAVEVIDPINVLVISGDESAGSTTRATTGATTRATTGATTGSSRFIRAALAPFDSAAQTGADPAKVRIVSSTDWPELDRSKDRVVILANVARFTLRQVRQLEQFVYGGGGLLVAPGNLADVDDYNTQLWRDGAGVLPAQLDSPLTAPLAGQNFSLGELDATHPAFSFLPQSLLSTNSVKINRYFPTDVGSTARVLGELNNNEPFMIEGSYGRGRVLLMTSSLDAGWSNLPMTELYLPMLQSAVRYLAAGIVSDRNLSPGESAVATITDAVEPSSAVMNGPQISSAGVPVELFRVSDGYEARFSGTTRPGHYTLRVKPASPDAKQTLIDFIVRPPRDESDLGSLSAEQWTTLERQLGFTRADPDPQAVASMILTWRRRRELWPVLLGCVIVLAVIEMGLARFWTAAAAAPARQASRERGGGF